MVHFVPVAIREMFAFISTESAQRLKSKSNQDASIHLDYCNSLLIGLPQKSLYKLQMVQNSAAVSLPKTPLFHHITPVLQQLHWLPVKFRIQFKILQSIPTTASSPFCCMARETQVSPAPPPDLRTSQFLRL